MIIGGCRSGKSGHALALGEAAGGAKHLFLATCAPQDEEMAARVRRHQLQRGDHWRTIEAPLEIVAMLAEHGPRQHVVLIDCLTLWITNLMLAHEEDDAIIEHIDTLAHALDKPPCHVIVVTNEVGAGIVPQNRLARRFRDLTGGCNQKLAAVCDQVVWMVAGIAVPIKTRG